MKINKFDRPIIQAFLAEVEEAIKGVCEKYEIIYSRTGTTRFSGEKLITNGLNFLVTSDDVKSSDDLARIEFAKNAWRFGLQPSDYGREITIRGTKYKVSGIKPSRYKFPINIERVHDGKSFKAPASSIPKSDEKS